MKFIDLFRSRYVMHLEAQLLALQEELREAHEERRGAINNLIAIHGGFPIEVRPRATNSSSVPVGKGMILPSTFRRQREAEDRKAAAQREEKPNAS